MKRTVLLTGATGLIGSRTLAPLQALGFDVIGTSRHPFPHSGFRHIQADLLSQEQMRAMLAQVRPMYVLHCAWDVTHGKFWHAPENADWAAATIDLARAAGQNGVRRFVALGSAAEYDWTDASEMPRRETDPTTPVTFYGVAKNAARLVLEVLCRAEGVSFAWGRVFDVFGPGEAAGRLMASLLDALRSGTPFICRHGQLVRDYMAADDVGISVAALVGSDAEGCINIAAGRSVSLSELTSLAAARVGRPDLLTVLHEPAPSSPLCIRADVTRLRREVGVPEPADLLRGIG
jgi:nucleoside-diphosphate-sugar epimerase